MSRPHILIATPFDGGDLRTARVTLGWHRFVRHLEKTLGADSLNEVVYSCDVVRARNRIVATVIRDLKATDRVLWLDDDTFADDFDEGARTVAWMAESGEALIAAPYTSKTTPARFVVNELEGEKPDERGLLSVRGVGFGFTMTSVACLQAVVDACASTGSAYYDLPHPHLIANVFGQIYDAGPDGRKYLASEDLSFCARWRALGGRVALMARAARIVHAGSRGYTDRDVP